MSVEAVPVTITEYKTPWDLTVELVADKGNVFYEDVYQLIDIADYIGWADQSNSVTGEARLMFECFKLSYAPGNLLKNMTACAHSVTAFSMNATSENATECFFNVANLIDPINDLCDLATKVIWHLPKEWFNTLSGVNGIVLVMNMMRDGYASGQKIQEGHSDLGMVLKVIREVSYITLGILLVMAAFSHVVIPAIAFTATSATAVFCTTALHYYDHWYEPKAVVQVK